MEMYSSISYIMTNLLIGLCKGSIRLRPYSLIFKNQLGYKLYKLEFSFKLSSGRTIVPEMILTSQKLSNTLLFEWTELKDISAQKQDQFDRYNQLSISDLINIAALPPSEVNNFDIVITVKSESVDSFQNYCKTNHYRYPILKISTNQDGINIIKVSEIFKEDQTDRFFSEGITCNNIPHYLPFSVENIDIKVLVIYIIQHITSLLTKGNGNYSTIELCSGYFPMWDFLGQDKQNAIVNITNRTLNTLKQKKYGRLLISRSNSGSHRWELNGIIFLQNPKGFSKQLKAFISEIQGNDFQLSFDFDESL